MDTDNERRSARRAVASGSAPRLSVVIPIRNEAGNLSNLFGALSGALNGVDHEVIVVDDSSDTVTRPVLTKIAATAPHWRVVERTPAEQTGLATAVTTGIAMARGDAICVMDGDLQHPPDVVPRLLQAVETDADLAVASRYAGGNASGLASGYRHLVSQSSRWLAYSLFPEARRTSDPLTGFFCFRRSAVAGVEFRPVGFKILLELLVLCPRLRVVDVHFVFASRVEGDSKASAGQGLLYLRHLVSLFLHVPESSQVLKFTLVTILSLAMFEGLFKVLMQSGEPVLIVWMAASSGSSLLNAVLQRALTFRRHSRGTLLYRAFGFGGSLAGLALYAPLLVVNPQHPMVMGTLAQGVALAIPLTVNLLSVRRWVRAMTGDRGMDLEELASHLDADAAWWSKPVPEPLDPPQRRLAPAGIEELIRNCAQSTTPDLVIQSPSDRPQPRRNIECLSAIIVPKPQLGHVAVLVRRSVKPLTAEDLEQALRLLRGPAAEADKAQLWLTVARP